MRDIESVREKVAKDVADALEYIGHEDFDVFNSGSKIVITLFDGRVYWFMYNPRTVEELYVYGAVLTCLMHQKGDANRSDPQKPVSD